jgi:hypothetical protein
VVRQTLTLGSAQPGGVELSRGARDTMTLLFHLRFFLFPSFLLSFFFLV